MEFEDARQVVIDHNSKRLNQVDEDVQDSRSEHAVPVDGMGFNQSQFDCDGNGMDGESHIWTEEVNGVECLIVEITANIYVPGTDAVRTIIPMEQVIDSRRSF